MEANFEGVDHNKVRQYLVGNGWQKQVDILEGVMEKYSKNNNILELVTLSELPTYQSYLADTLHSISIIENLPIENVRELISTAGLIKFSIILGKGSGSHRIRLNESAKLRNSIETIFLATTHSELSPAINHPKLSKKEALEFVEECFEDQTKASSYMANFLVPNRKFDHLSGASVVQKIKSAITASKKIANLDILPASTEYDDLAKKGISSNLLGALADLKGLGDVDKISFTFGDDAAVELSSEELTNIQDFSSEIIQPSTEIKSLFGNVIATSYQPECTATIETNLDGNLVRLKIKISNDSYKDILHEESRLEKTTGDLANRPKVNVVGKLRKRSRGRYEMAEVDTIKIV